ncbi:DUF1697 domain-containing protein [Sphingomonas sp. 7/4-4]|uniref:DUF1697 domain-containing protein n=1 Tax=Sphingomonas sp. 7/4-4 TaxID=3018446 RepID=UPI0022F38651|nr:DUF1697 domain-containing protein [Sphingomonas sp. 7/4-4]WBY07131.1 DUF1697 domain-containing protein [Sphingomonas sp. 7/4-4]
MASHIALLHSITIGGGRRLVMADWRAMMETLGLERPQTLVSTGNALFESEPAAIGQLERRLETAFEQCFGRHVDTIVKTAAHWRRLAASNPFPDEAERDGTRVAVRVMRKPLDGAAIEALMHYATQGERLRLAEGHLWAHFEKDPVRSRLVPQLTTRRLGVGTVRNWNTVRRLDDMIAGRRHPDRAAGA